MITEIDIVCDRCGKTVHGLIIEAEGGIPKITGGFYDVKSPSVWGQFSLTPQEQNVCDECMWLDERFLKEYPHNRKVSKSNEPTQPPPVNLPFAEFLKEKSVSNREVTERIPMHKRAAHELKKLDAPRRKLQKENPPKKDPKPPKDK